MRVESGSNPTILDISVYEQKFHFFEVGHNVFTTLMLKCPVTFHSKWVMSKEDIQIGLASAYWLTSFGNQKDTPVNLGEGHEPVLHILKDLIVYSHFITFEQKQNYF